MPTLLRQAFISLNSSFNATPQQLVDPWRTASSKYFQIALFSHFSASLGIPTVHRHSLPRTFHPKAADYLRLVASDVSDPGKPVLGRVMADLTSCASPCPLPKQAVTLSTAGCANSGKNVANLNSLPGSPLQYTNSSGSVGIKVSCICIERRHTLRVRITAVSIYLQLRLGCLQLALHRQKALCGSPI